MSSPQNSSKGKPTQENKKGWFSGLFFKEEDIGLNSVKQVSKTVDTNISKITEFIKQRQHYVQYFLYGSALFGVTFLTFYYQSVKVSKQNLFNSIAKQKNMISKKSIAYEAFNSEINFPNNNLKVFKELLKTQNLSSYKDVMGYYKGFNEFTRYPLHLIGENGTGKTELLRHIFKEVRDISFGEIMYVDVDVVTRQAQHLSEVLFYKYPQYKHYRKIFQSYSDEIKKPTILIDNFHLLPQFPKHQKILEEIQYYRWIESFNFLFASQYRQPQLFFKVNMIQTQIQGVMEPKFYEQFVKSLKLGLIEEQVLFLRPSVYLLQDLFLCPQNQRTYVLESIKRRHISQLQYYNIDRPESLQKFNNGDCFKQFFNKTGVLKDGLLQYDKDAKITYGSEFVKNLIKQKNK